MNRIIPAILALTAAPLMGAERVNSETESSEKIRYQLILPEEKTPEQVKPNEANPFNKSDGGALKPEDASSEENKVKDSLLQMRVSGAAMNADGTIRAVMLGELKLERGMTVPQIVPDQQVHLRVNAITESTVELFWIEKKRNVTLPPRPVIIPVNLKPYVRYMLPRSGDGLELAQPSAGPGRAMGLQTSPDYGRNPFIAAPETKRAVPAAGGAASPANAATGNGGQQTTPPTKPDTGADKTHPANMLMNLLLNKGPVPTQGAAPAQSDTPPQK